MARKPHRCPDCKALYPERRAGNCTNPWHDQVSRGAEASDLRVRIDQLAAEVSDKEQAANRLIDEYEVQIQAIQMSLEAAQAQSEAALEALSRLIAAVDAALARPIANELHIAQAFLDQHKIAREPD